MAKRILVADDEPTVLMLALQKLTEHGYEVETAKNGREAWEIVSSQHIDLVILDVIMPVMDGVDVYKEIKKNPQTANIPIIIITDSQVFKQSFQTLGVEHFLPKPLDGERLLHKAEYVFTCAELDVQNKQVLVLSPSVENNAEMAKILEGHRLVVGKTWDPIEFLTNCLILNPRMVLIDIFAKGAVQPPEIVRALRCFVRLMDAKILLFTQLDPADINGVDGVEKIRAAKNDCMTAGADKYIGRFCPSTFFDMVKDYIK